VYIAAPVNPSAPTEPDYISPYFRPEGGIYVSGTYCSITGNVVDGPQRGIWIHAFGNRTNTVVGNSVISFLANNSYVFTCPAVSTTPLILLSDYECDNSIQSINAASTTLIPMCWRKGDIQYTSAPIAGSPSSWTIGFDLNTLTTALLNVGGTKLYVASTAGVLDGYTVQAEMSTHLLHSSTVASIGSDGGGPYVVMNDAVLFSVPIGYYVLFYEYFTAAEISGPAGGDLSGTYPNPTVAKIQGYDIATTAPQDGYALVYESSTAKWTPEHHINYGVFAGADVDSYGLLIPTNDTLALWSNKVSGSASVSTEIVANVNSATIDADHKIAAFYWRDNVNVKHEVFNIKDGEINITTAASAAMFSDQADGGSSVAVTLGSTNSFVTAGAKLLSIMNGDPAGLERAYIDYRGDVCVNKLDNAQSLNIKSLSELTTIAAAADGYSVIQIPANCIVVAVSARVTTVIPTATTFSVGIIGGITRYGYSISTAAGSTSIGTNDALRYYAVATSILFKPNATPAAATGRVRTTIHFIEIAPPTS
jgi:hypothetical protein